MDILKMYIPTSVKIQSLFDNFFQFTIYSSLE